MVSYDMYQLSTLWSGCKVPFGPWNGSRWKRLSIQRIKHLKTPLFLKISSWSLWGYRGSWQTLRWCHMTCINSMKLMWKFHPNPTSGSLSRLYLSSKSLPGVFEERGVHEEPGNGVIWNVSPSEVAVCHMTCINSMKLMWKFHPNLTSGTPSRLYSSSKSLSWSLGEHGGSWQTWRWCQMNGSILMNLLWGFHQEPTSSQYI